MNIELENFTDRSDAVHERRRMGRERENKDRGKI